MQGNNFTHPTTDKHDLRNQSGSSSGSLSESLFPLVAIGAAGGGLDALCALLDQVSPTLGMAYVLIIYLSVDETEVRDVLQRHTSMPVLNARNNLPLEMNRVYVLPADNHLGLDTRRFVHLPVFRPEKAYHAIDHFFTAMAGTFTNNAFAILLSGTGTDGTAGIRAVRAEGGITFAQDETAAYRGMPQNAVDAGYIDFVLPPQGIASRLEILKNYSFRNGAVLTHLQSNPSLLSRIYLLLSARFSVDFSHYKQSTINRRIIRRMTLNTMPNLETYVRRLEADEVEADALYKDLLSGMGGFFREAALGRLLTKKIIPALLKDRKPDHPIRVWIPSCSGGEEATSIAIQLLECMQTKEVKTPIQIFCTDLNDATVRQARSGFFSRSAVQHISPLRLKRFFTRVEGGYQVIKAIRDICIFARHNFLKDPPFANIDIISCQNVLPSLEHEMQDKALQTFHYALKREGFLLLGRTDAPEENNFFTRAYKEWNVFSKTVNMPAYSMSFLPPALAAAAPQRAGGEKAADSLMLTRYTPAGFLIDDSHHIIRFYGPTSDYVRPQDGKASLQLFKIIHEDLTYELKNLLERIKKEGQIINKKGILLHTEEGMKEVSLEIAPVRQSGETLWLVVIEDRLARGTQNSGTPPDDPEHLHVRRLEESLVEAGRQIMAAHDEYALTREELQAAHEELLSSNEELRSINDEMEVSKEALQCAVEEMRTINDELNLRNAELKEAVEYAEAIVETITSPLLDLYSDLRVRMANKAFYNFFGLHPDEIEGGYLDEGGGGLFNMPALMDSLRQAMTKRLPLDNLELVFDIPALGKRTVLLNAVRINGQPGKRARMLLVMEDVTERKMMERRKDEFIGIASHELKIPVTSIQAYTQILYNEFVESNDTRSVQMVSKLNNQVIRLTNLMKDLLDITRISQGQMQLKLAAFDLHALVAEVADDMQRTTHHRIVFSPEPLVSKFRGDRERIGQVLRNLVSNAIKYSPGADRIVIGLGMLAKTLYIHVQDFGIGMDAETQEKVFERWFRSHDPAAYKYPGLGLGLYISNEIVQQHGGSISVQSEPGKGAIFTVALPVLPSPES
jgi:two-component system CheB/CheR fusion protein